MSLFFFQAEDGIRDRSPSRGLGDVYKRQVRGSPIQMDLSANIYFNEKITFGAAYRLDAAISAIAGFALSDRAFVGFAYDYQTTAIQQFSSGSYEMILRFTIPRKGERILTPRFF